MIDEIKTNYQKLTHKETFLTMLAFKFDMNIDYITQKWFSSKWKIPLIKQKEVLEILTKQVKFDERQKKERQEFTRNL